MQRGPWAGNIAMGAIVQNVLPHSSSPITRSFYLDDIFQMYFRHIIKKSECRFRLILIFEITLKNASVGLTRPLRVMRFFKETQVEDFLFLRIWPTKVPFFARTLSRS